MSKRSIWSILALQQKLSRPGITIVFFVFTVVYLIYLVTLLGINAQKGWSSTQEVQITYDYF